VAQRAHPLFRSIADIAASLKAVDPNAADQ